MEVNDGKESDCMDQIENYSYPKVMNILLILPLVNVFISTCEHLPAILLVCLISKKSKHVFKVAILFSVFIL